MALTSTEVDVAESTEIGSPGRKRASCRNVKGEDKSGVKKRNENPVIEVRAKLLVSVDQKIREVGTTGGFTSWAASCLQNGKSLRSCHKLAATSTYL